MRDFYERYYDAMTRSRAHAAFCERVFGRNLCQHGFADMTQLDALIEAARLGPGQAALDLGCGNGMIAEYISDRTGAHVTGLDYIPAAIRHAQARTAAKSDRLAFVVGDINALDLEDGAYDVIISIDTMYFSNDTAATIGQLLAALRPGGRHGDPVFSRARAVGARGGVPGRDAAARQDAARRRAASQRPDLRNVGLHRRRIPSGAAAEASPGRAQTAVRGRGDHVHLRESHGRRGRRQPGGGDGPAAALSLSRAAACGFSNCLTEARDDAILLDTIAERSNFKPDAFRILSQFHFRIMLPIEGLTARFLHNPRQRHRKRNSRLTYYAESIPHNQ